MILALAVGGWATARELHPMDGPDADVRIKITDERVRMTCAFNLAFVDAVVDVPREAEDLVAGPELDAIRSAMFAHLADVNDVEIDGVSVQPVDGGFEFLEAPPDLVPLFPRFGARALAKVQLILDYPAKAAPERVRFTWGPFPRDAVLSAGEHVIPIEINAQLRAEGLDSLVPLRVDANTFTWEATGVGPEERFLPVPALEVAPTVVPVASIVLLVLAFGVLGSALRPGASKKLRRRAAAIGMVLFGASVPARDIGAITFGAPPEPTPDEARAIFGPLHANIYRAFDYDTESEIYDALARSVDGPLLDELYDQMYRSLLNAEADGARSTVQGVRLLDFASAPREEGDDARHGFDVEATWQVDGAVYHWGHAHTRTNEYSARYGVRATPDGWRLAASRILAERRVDAAPLGPLPIDDPNAPIRIDPPLQQPGVPEGFRDL